MSASVGQIRYDTREGWLVAGLCELDKVFFRENGYELPEKLQVSCGWARGSAKAIGQCFDPQWSGDKTTQMFVCPSISDPIQVLATLLHEMIHACVGCEIGHRGVFRKLAKEFGLSGRMTATFAQENSELWHALRLFASRLGTYPHASMKKKRAKPRNRSRRVRLMSPKDDTYKLTISRFVLDEHGAPIDPWGEEMVPIN